MDYCIMERRKFGRALKKRKPNTEFQKRIEKAKSFTPLKKLIGIHFNF